VFLCEANIALELMFFSSSNEQACIVINSYNDHTRAYY
jgi:hypothetical protein